MRRKWLVPLLLLALLTLCFLWGVTGYPHPAQLPSGGSLEAPSAAHWLGTDNLGVDIYAQISAGFFRSLGIGLAAAAFTFAVGGGLGILAGFAGGWADALISFLIQVLLAIPQLPVMIVIGAFLGQSTWNLVWIIAAFSWAPVARQMRAKTISIRRRDYVQMARLYGGGTWYLIRTHIGHELWPLLTINALAVVGRAILQESSLAFLGLSDPLARSWGMMIARAVDFPGLYRTDFWTWWLLPPVGALVLSTLLLRLLVGGLRNNRGGQTVLLEMNNLSVSYPEFTLHPVSFALDAGEMLTIVGESGSGKTTLARAIACLSEPEAQVSGQVYLNGRELLAMDERARRPLRMKEFALSFQNSAEWLNPSLTLAEHLREVLCRAYRGAAMAARMEELMALVGLETADLERYPRELSGGMVQKFLLANARALNPALVLLDEPTGALDIASSRGITALIQELNRRLGTAFLVITHDMKLAADLGGRTVVLYDGHVEEAGDTRAL